MTLHIELASDDQVQLVYESMREAYLEYDGVLIPPTGALRESVDDVRAAMSKGGAVLAWDEGEVVGSARFLEYPDYLYVGRVAVSPSHRGKGVGSALMACIEDIGRERGFHEIQLIVRLALPGNKAFYEQLDYEVFKTVPHEKGGDLTLYMRKSV